MDEPAPPTKSLQHYSAAELAEELLALENRQRHLQGEIDEGRGTREVLEAFDWITARADQLFEYVCTADLRGSAAGEA
jgi:hypothetical protein